MRGEDVWNALQVLDVVVWEDLKDPSAKLCSKVSCFDPYSGRSKEPECPTVRHGQL